MNFLWSLLAGLAGGLALTALGGGFGKQQAPAPEPMLAPPASSTPGDPANKAPDYNAMLGKNQKAARSGPSAGGGSTFLTGASGIDPSQLNLGSNTLLGS